MSFPHPPKKIDWYLMGLLSLRWIAKKISDILGVEDDVVIELCFNLLEGTRFVRRCLAIRPQPYLI